MTVRTISIAGALAGCLALGACATVSLDEPTARVVIRPASGSSVSGQLVFVQTGSMVRISGELSGHSPGPRAVHIHEKGDCSAPDGMSAGGHFNPGGHPHGHPHKGPHHAGDMPMLETDGYGNARLVAVLPGLTLAGANGIVGKGVIVHAAPDDFKTQPTGNSGARMACGVIVQR